MLRLYSMLFTWSLLGLVACMLTTPTTPTTPTTSPQSQRGPGGLTGLDPSGLVRSVAGGMGHITRSVLTDLVLSATKTGQIAVDKGSSIVCGRICKFPLIQMFCPLVCSPRRLKNKRSITKHIKNDEHLLPMPNHFSAYDLNEDGVVSPKELAFVTGQDMKDTNLKMAFNLADKNDDKVLTPMELYEGPFVFEMDISKDDETFCQYMMYRRDNPISESHSA